MRQHTLPMAFAVYAADSPWAQDKHAPINRLAAFNSIEEFWSIYNYLVRPNQLPTASELSIFKEYILPLWEDPNNSKGGKIFIKLKKEYGARCFENLVIGFIAGEFQSQEISGVNVAVKNHEHVLSVWIQDASNKDAIDRVSKSILRILDIPQSYAHLMYFKQFF